MHGRRVPYDMGRAVFGRQAGTGRYGSRASVLSQVVHAFARQRLAPGLGESHRPGGIATLSHPGVQSRRGIRP